MAQDSSTPTASSPLKLLIYWAIVAVPLTWGVYKTVIKSQPLFTATGAPASAPPAAATPTAATPAPLATAAPDASPAATAAPAGT